MSSPVVTTTNPLLPTTKKIFGPCFLALYKSIIEHNKTLAKIDPSLSVDHIDDYYHHQASGLRHGGVG